jgi:hypothetical protein
MPFVLRLTSWWEKYSSMCGVACLMPNNGSDRAAGSISHIRLIYKDMPESTPEISPDGFRYFRISPAYKVI